MEHDEPILLKNINIYYNNYKHKNTVYLNLIKCYALMLVLRDYQKKIKNPNLFNSDIIKNLLEDNHDVVAYYIFKIYNLLYKQNIYDKNTLLKLSADVVVKFHTFDYNVILLMKRYYDKFSKHLNKNNKIIINIINQILNIENDLGFFDSWTINKHFNYLNWNVN